MPEIRRIFLDWKNPVTTGVINHVTALAEKRHGSIGKGQPLDLDGIMIIVPTRQAGRHLREELALYCADRESTLLSARIVTTNTLFALNDPDTASSVRVTAAWIETLQASDLSEFPAMFPDASVDRGLASLINMSRIIQNLREELTDGGYTIASVLDQYETELVELGRWQDLLKLETVYLQRLASHSLKDPCMAKIELAESPEDDDSISTIILAGIADPSLLALKAVTELAKRCSVEILVHAPEELADQFDEWGRPILEKWASRTVDIPNWSSDVFLEASAEDQSARVLAEISGGASKFEAGEIAIGVPDHEVVPFMQSDLAEHGLPAFDPSDIHFRDHALGHLVQYVHNLITVRRYGDAAALLRHPHFCGYLEETQGLSTRSVLTQLDEFQNHYLPVLFEDMLVPFTHDPKGIDSKYDDFTELGRALTAIDVLLDGFGSGPAGLAEGWHSLLTAVYTAKRLNSREIKDTDFKNAADVLSAELRAVSDLSDFMPSLSLEDSSSILLSAVNDQTFHRERRREIIDLEGWLELPWNSRPFLLVAGMNEEYVPGESVGSTFLPNSLRQTLALRDDARRLARDAFLMQGMIESRRANGRACFIVGKTSAVGDALKPSRLMLKCSDEELPQRAKKLFSGVEQSTTRPHAQAAFPVEVGLAAVRNDIPDSGNISVTAIKDYLACPFRFYLKHILKMSDLADVKTGPDHLDFGNIIHGVLETMGRDRALWASTDSGELGDRLAELTERQVYARFGRTSSLAVQVTLLAAIQRLRALASAQVALVRDGWEVQEEYVESASAWTLAMKGFTVRGRIDRVDRNSNTGQYRIIDYKTSDSAAVPMNAHMLTVRDDTPDHARVTVGGKVKRWVDVQLPLYFMMAEGKLGTDIGLAYFNLPKAVSYTGIYEWKGLENEIIEAARTCTEGVLSSIAAEKFGPPSDSYRYDDFGYMLVDTDEETLRIPGSS